MLTRTMRLTPRLFALTAGLLAVLALLVMAAPVLAPLAIPSPAVAQTATPPSTEKPAPKALFPRPSTQAQAPQPPSGPLAGAYMWIAEKQQAFTRTLASALRDIKTGNAFTASLLLIAVSFAYGVLHAAGPGHGKAIVSSYMLADNQTVRRGIWLAALSSLIQAISAIALFGIVVLIARGARSEIVSTETMLERMSWAIVAAFGAWLLFRQIRALVTGRPVHDHAHHDHAHHDHGHAHHHHGGHVHGPSCNHAHHDHAHDHAHDHSRAHTAVAAKAAPQAHSHHTHGHDHTHTDGDVCETCGHAHIPTAEAVQGEWSWKRALTLALAVGIRPCTGAIGVLFVANGLGLMWAGIASTFAMSVGTAITVSALAALAVGSRDLATRIAGTSDNSWAARAQTAIGLAGAALVFGLGATFFYYSLSTPQPF